MALIGLRLLPPYIDNFRFQQYLNSLLADPAVAKLPVDEINARVVAQAVSLGLPITPQDVRVTRTENEFKIEVLYLVHVDLRAYTVDIHFRPTAGGA